MTSPNGTKALILVSGGIDSCVTAAIAVREYECLFVHFDYGQYTEVKERDAFEKLAEHYNVDNKFIIRLDGFKTIGHSALIKDAPFSGDKYAESSTYVPFRNGVFLSYAAATAEVNNLTNIFIGVMEEDSSGYPDCREGFIESMAAVINAGTRRENELKIVTPIIHRTKAEVIALGKSLNAPLELTWSCYYDDDKACGKCPSCKLRLKAFREAGYEDPIEYR